MFEHLNFVFQILDSSIGYLLGERREKTGLFACCYAKRAVFGLVWRLGVEQKGACVTLSVMQSQL